MHEASRKSGLRSVEEDWTRPLIVGDLDGKALGPAFQRPSYSPDGQRIVYKTGAPNTLVRVASVADGRGVPLDAESIDQHSPAWSPDGKWIAYQRLQGDGLGARRKYPPVAVSPCDLRRRRLAAAITRLGHPRASGSRT